MSSTQTHPSRILPFLGLACGVGVSTIYYNQPLLAEFAKTFHVGADQVGLVAVATQVGYALGLLFFVPMGDLRERRGLMRKLYAAVSVTLFLTALAPNLPVLIVCSILSGSVAAVTHIALPIAPDFAPKGKGGRAIGIVMTGLLLGVLLARTFSGWINDAFVYINHATGNHMHFAGWRAVYLLAAIMNACFVPALKRLIPELPPKQPMRYTTAMQSLLTVFREEPLLRESATMGALIFAAFSCFWNTLAFLLATHGLGAGVAGTFGLVGAAGALIAAFAGRTADRRGPRYVLTGGLCLLTVAYLGLWGSESALHLPLGALMAIFALFVVVLDIGAQMSQIANQTRIFSLRPEARSRVNTVYMVIYFAGAAVGSALSTIAWQHWGWNGVCILALGFLALAALRHVTGDKSKYTPHTTEHTRDFILEG